MVVRRDRHWTVGCILRRVMCLSNSGNEPYRFQWNGWEWVDDILPTMVQVDMIEHSPASCLHCIILQKARKKTPSLHLGLANQLFLWTFHNITHFSTPLIQPYTTTSYNRIINCVIYHYARKQVPEVVDVFFFNDIDKSFICEEFSFSIRSSLDSDLSFIYIQSVGYILIFFPLNHSLLIFSSCFCSGGDVKYLQSKSLI